MKSMFLILSIFFFVTSCVEEEEKQQESTIYNKWSLIKYEPGFSPTENFNIGQIYWTFQKNNIVKIQVDNSVNSSPIISDGDYEFLLDGNKILVNDIEYDFLLNENVLVISNNPSSDGFRATFSKIVDN